MPPLPSDLYVLATLWVVTTLYAFGVTVHSQYISILSVDRSFLRFEKIFKTEQKRKDFQNRTSSTVHIQMIFPVLWHEKRDVRILANPDVLHSEQDEEQNN